MFKELTLDDLKNNPIRVDVRKQTTGSIRMSLYCNNSAQGLNSKKLEGVKYLTVKEISYGTGESYDAHYLKITKKQKGQYLLQLIMAHIDNIFRTDEPLDINLAIYDNVMFKGEIYGVVRSKIESTPNAASLV
tara:strand:- start:4001 stop:4399 length:399 start_codon:yes stop_codon:yes gene_type:complete